jgi:hypothetical protein
MLRSNDRGGVNLSALNLTQHLTDASGVRYRLPRTSRNDHLLPKGSGGGGGADMS